MLGDKQRKLQKVFISVFISVCSILIKKKTFLAFETDQQLGIPYVLTELKKPYIPKHRIVHFDLKGAPPTIIYFKKVISLAKNAGATGILIGMIF